jgi:excisionase family DNA binding protein
MSRAVGLDTARVRPRGDGWLTTAEAAAILGRSPHTVGHLARTGRLPWKREGRRLLVDEAAVREYAAKAAQWVSYIRAAQIVGCSETAILHAVQRGDIKRRKVESNAQPALSRSSVDRFAGEWAVRQAERECRRTQREAKKSGPPEDGQVWLTSATAALVLGITTSRLRQLAQKERVPFTQTGGRRWYRRDHLEQLSGARCLSRLVSEGRVLAEQTLASHGELHGSDSRVTRYA